MSEMDEIEQAAALAEAETGAHGAGAGLRVCRSQAVKQGLRHWTSADNAYIREHHGRVSEAEMAAHLSRTHSAVHLHIVRNLHLTAPSKSPEILTAEQVAWGFGADSKSIHMLMDRGLMPHRRLPGKDMTRVVGRQTLLRWMLAPGHWIYFDPERVGAMRARGKRALSICYDYKFWEDARRIVMAAKERWRDEWLTPGRVAIRLGLPRRFSRLVNKAIHRGNIRAKRWGNWWIKRSDAPGPDKTINSYGMIVEKSQVRRWKYTGR